MKNIIETIIKDLAAANFNHYPSDYTPQNSNYAMSELAKGYWENRTIEEVERDEQAGVTIEDYETWVIETISAKIEA